MDFMDFLGRCGQFVYIRPQFYPGGWCRTTSTASYQVLSYHLFYHLNTFENDSRKRHDLDRWMQTGLHACVLFVQFWSRKIFIEFESNGIVLKILCVDQLGTPPIANLKAGKISWSYRGGGSTLVISRYRAWLHKRQWLALPWSRPLSFAESQWRVIGFPPRKVSLGAKTERNNFRARTNSRHAPLSLYRGERISAPYLKSTTL